MLEDNKVVIKKVVNGIGAEVISSTLTYPINTIRTYAQLGKKINITPSVLFKGMHYSIINEIINGILFYATFHYLEKYGPIIQSSVGSLVAMTGSHPVYQRRKLAQIGKAVKITNNYSGFGNALVNNIPSVALNFALKEQFKPRLGIYAGYLSTCLSMAITHPLDTITAHVLTKTPFKLSDSLKFHGFKQRFVEKGLTIGSKMMLLDYFNEKNN